MAVFSFRPFQNGYRLIDGFKLNQLFTGAMSFAANLTTATIGTLTVTAGMIFTGAFVGTVTTVAAAGATLGTATAIPTTAFLVKVTVTASTEGVKLPTAVAGKQIWVLANATVGNKVYGAAAGQLIGTNTTATTAYVLAKNTSTVFTAIDTTHWRITKGA